MPLQETSGAASYDAFGGGVAVVPNYIEDVFSTYLYIGEGATQTITNGIDLSGKGGLVWTKARSSVSGAPTYYTHELTDTVRGANNGLTTSTTAPQSSSDVNGFTSTGFNLTYSTGRGNAYQINEVSWTFREQPKFFDVVTWTGDSTPRTIAHNLGSVPGCIMVKCTSMATDWNVYHQSLGNTFRVNLNQTSAAVDIGDACWNATTPTSTVFSLGTNSGVNSSGSTYVAYLFAHNAGGFGLTGTDNVISCGSFVTDGSGIGTVNLGYEPQWVLTKKVNGSGNWQITDVMRAWTNPAANAVLIPNLTNAETSPTGSSNGAPNATGFTWEVGVPDQTYIYIAIRRGPMKVPTSGTSVFSPSYGLSASNSEFVNAGFPIDLNWRGRTTGDNVILQDRLRAADNLLFSNLTAAESNAGGSFVFTTQNGCTFTSTANFSTWVNWSFRRAPSFFDEVCYTGTGSATTQTHNLAVVPELLIVKNRTTSNDWVVYSATLGANKFLYLRVALAEQAIGNELWNSTTPTSSVFSIGTYGNVNTSAEKYVAYLFATCAGVSKVGSYTGTGATQTINCGFGAGGSRFVLIKRTDTTGDWYVWDSARGMVSGTDPSLLLNSTAAEVNANSIYTISTGFQIVSTAAGINASGGTYIFLSIA